MTFDFASRTALLAGQVKKKVTPSSLHINKVIKEEFTVDEEYCFPVEELSSLYAAESTGAFLVFHEIL